MPSRSTLGQFAAALLAVAGAAVCAYYGLTDHGIYHPDEIFQTLEPAHRLTYGYGLTTWEWRVGARNWALPAFLSAGFWIAELAGLEHSPKHLVPVTMLVCAATAATTLGVYRLARRLEVRPSIAVYGVAMCTFCPLTLYLGHRPLAEVVSAPLVVWGLALTVGRAGETNGSPSGWRASRVGLSLLALAVFCRPHNAIFAVGVVGVFRWRGALDAYSRAVDVFAVWGLVYGLVDWATWGVPFQSAGAYLRANLIMGVTTDYYASSPPGLLVGGLFDTAGPIVVALAVGALVGARRASGLAVVTGAFLLVHQLFPHKQLRFVYPAIPVLAALAAVGFEVLVERLEVSWRLVAGGVGVLAAATVGYGLYQTPRLTIGDVRQSNVLRTEPDRSAHRFRHGVNELLVEAGHREDLCGLYVREPWIVKTGGATYLHRDVPIYHRLQRPPSRRHFNYAIVRESEEEGANRDSGLRPRPVARRGEFVLLETREGACEADPDYASQVDK